MTIRKGDTKLPYLLRVQEYSQYLFEAEEKRAERCQEATKTYLLFIGSTFAGMVGALEWLNIRPIALLSNTLSLRETFVAYALLLSLLALGISFLLTVLVIRVWQRERLCEPRDFLVDAAFVDAEAELLERIIADFVVASERNSTINDEKARLLGTASQAYRLSLILLTMAALTYIIQ